MKKKPKAQQISRMLEDLRAFVNGMPYQLAASTEDDDHWSLVRGETAVRLMELKEKVPGLAAELAGRHDRPEALQNRITDVLDALGMIWVPTIRTGELTLQERENVNAVHGELEAVARTLRNVAAPSDLLSPIQAAKKIVDCHEDTIRRRINAGILTDYDGMVSAAEVTAKKPQLVQRKPRKQRPEEK